MEYEIYCIKPSHAPTPHAGREARFFICGTDASTEHNYVHTYTK